MDLMAPLGAAKPNTVKKMAAAMANMYEYQCGAINDGGKYKAADLLKDMFLHKNVKWNVTHGKIMLVVLFCGQTHTQTRDET